MLRTTESLPLRSLLLFHHSFRRETILGSIAMVANMWLAYWSTAENWLHSFATRSPQHWRSFQCLTVPTMISFQTKNILQFVFGETYADPFFDFIVQANQTWVCSQKRRRSWSWAHGHRRRQILIGWSTGRRVLWVLRITAFDGWCSRYCCIWKL